MVFTGKGGPNGFEAELRVHRMGDARAGISPAYVGEMDPTWTSDGHSI